MSPPWLRQRERGSLRLLRLMHWLTRHLGLGAGDALLHPIALYYLLLSPGPRAASGRFLRLALGRRPSLKERYRHVLTFARTIMDRALLAMGRFDDFEVEVRGREIVDELIAQGRGFVLLGAHLGSFEVLRAFADQGCPVPVRMMMYEGNAGRLHGFLSTLGPGARSGVIPIGGPEAALRAKEALDAGEMLGILGDRFVVGERTATVDFLGQPARFPVGPLVLASILQAPVVLFFGLHTGTRRYAVEFERFADRIALDRGSRATDLAGLVGRYARAVEGRCRRHPFNWFNFYDFWETGEGRDERAARAGDGGVPARGTAALR